MRDLAVLFLHLLATVARLAGPGGARSVVAESVLVKHQLLILNRSRKRSPNLRPSDRVVAGLCANFVRPGRLIRSAIVFKPSTLLSLHRALIQRKYRRLFSSTEPMKPGPKGPSQEVIAAVVDMKQRNPSWGCPRIAQQITLAFGIPIDRNVVRRILAARYEPKPDSADDPLYWFHQWQRNLRILDVKEIKTVPYVPLSHPFVERLIGTVRRECLDRTMFWTGADLETKLFDFQRYYNGHRAHAGLDGRTPDPSPDPGCGCANVSSYRWQLRCRGLYQTPMAA